MLFNSYSLLKPIQVFDGVWNHSILSIMVSKYFRNIFNWKESKIWDCLFKCLVTSLHQIMSVTLYQHELLWDICNARGVIIIVYSGIKKTLPDYFLSDHEFRCSFLGSVRALSGVVIHTQFSRLTDMGHMQWKFNNSGLGCIPSFYGEIFLKERATTKDGIWVTYSPGNVCTPLLYISGNSRRVLWYKISLIKSVADACQFLQ